MRPKRAADCASVLCVLAHLSLSLAHTLLSRRALQLLPPISLAALQLAAVALSLWFWSLFGLFRVRALPPPHILRLALRAALVAALHMTLLARSCSALWLFALLRATPVAMLRAPRAALCATAAALLTARAQPRLLALGALYVCAMSARAARAARDSAQQLRASELQLALWRSGGAAALLLAPAAAALARDGGGGGGGGGGAGGVLLCACCVLAFARFVSARALVARCSARVCDATLVGSLVPLLMTAWWRCDAHACAASLFGAGVLLMALDAVRCRHVQQPQHDAFMRELV